MKCIVLAGGSGDRLWPLSRKNYPKQFINIKNNRSLFQETIARNIPFCDEFYIITQEKYQNIAEGQLKAFQGLKYRCFLENEGRKTAPAVAIACMCSNQSEDFLVVSTDHIIDGGDYKGAILEGRELVRQGKLVCIGVRARYLDEGYGYIEAAADGSIRVIEQLEEISGMEEYPENLLWDTGILMINAGDYLNELEKYNRNLFACLTKCVNKLDLYHRNVIINKEAVKDVEAISIGKAITEKSDKVQVIRGNFEWSRIMSLEALDKYHHKRDLGNAIQTDCKNVSILNYSDDRLVVANDVRDLMVVSTPDAVYVSRKDSASQIKNIIQEHYDSQKDYFDEGNIYYTQWGIKETLNKTAGYKVKKLTIFAGKALTMHKHMMRSEHWSVVSGVASILIGDKEQEYHQGESVVVPAGTLHQIANRTTEDLVIIEISISTQKMDSEDIITVAGQTEACAATDSFFRLEPAFKDNLWGGTKLRRLYGKKCDYDVLAESWELSTHKDGQSVIAEGSCKGMLLGEYLETHSRRLLGWKCEPFERFPLLIKFIDARDDLSIQVHPDDDYALREENEYGKNEMWYIMDCEPGAYLYYGFNREVTPQEIRKRIEDCTLPEVLNKIPVRKGQTIFVKAGTVHAIGKGILICEIQQSSNVTYRLYDYGRRDKYGKLRELHVEKALDVIDFTPVCERNIEEDVVVSEVAVTAENNACVLGECKYFSVIKYECEDTQNLLIDESSFRAIVIVEGKGTITCEDKVSSFKPADTFFVPAGKKKLQIHGTCTVLCVRV
jgi:mannose-1-phosphate guanylyltransferase/mannose-6-phosphate isomerase